MSAAMALGLLLAFGFTQTAAAQSAAAGSINGPLAFENNFFVTGDYVVAGAYGMTTQVKNGFATGTITIPDANPGITGVKSVPAGAEVLAALLYWQTVEKLGVTPGGPESGQNGFFGPVVNNVPQFYPISGVDLMGQNTVSFSGGGCTGGSTGKVVRTYRAAVRGYLPVDPNTGIVLANGKYEVMLPGSGSTTPIALGATLVIIYRILDPKVPLNSIVIYDGAFAPGNALLNMKQTVQGFYDAAHDPASRVSRLTHIVGNGHSNKFENVYLNDLSHALSPLYPNGLPPFPGWYGSWDNTTWTFGDPRYGNVPNPVAADAAQATTMVAPATSQQGCVSWGAVIFSTTVQNSDNDGLLDVWKKNQGYCDASFNEAGNNPDQGSCTSAGSQWVDLTGAGTPGSGQDVFVQLDFMCGVVNSNHTCNGTYLLTSASTASGGNTAYTGTFSPTLPANSTVNISGFANTFNNGLFTVVSNTSAQLVVNNANGVAETHPGTATNTYLLTAAGTASGGNTTYTGTFSPALPANSTVNISGFTNTSNNGSFAVVSNTSTQLVVSNANGVAESNPGTALVDSFDPRLTVDIDGKNPVQKVISSFAGVGTSTNHAPVNLHVVYTNAVQEQACTDDFVDSPNMLCPYPNQAGVVGWKQGLIFLKNTFVDTNDQVCTTPPFTNCVLRFQHGKKDSYHYAIFAHIIGLPNWTLQTGTLKSVTQKGNLVTFTTSTPHGLVQASGMGDQNPLARVTVGFAITNPSLNGTFYVHSVPNVPNPTTFTIQLPNSSTTTTVPYTLSTDPNLAVGSGQVGTVSGFSDIAGEDSLITVDSWGVDASVSAKTGTFMHELGHSLGLTHGGFYYDKLTANTQDYTPAVEVNCKPNFQSVMSYMFQVDLLDSGGLVNVPDYSGAMLAKVGKSTANSDPFGLLSYQTSWHGTKPELESELGVGVVDHGTPLTLFCDGRPLPPPPNTPSVFRVTRTATLLSWEAGQDINFDGKIDPPFRGHNDWAPTFDSITGILVSPGADPRQIGATGSLSESALVGGGQQFGPGGGGQFGPGGGQQFGPGGGGQFGPGGGGQFGPGGGGQFGPGGGGQFGPGGGQGEINRTIANSFTRPPRNLTASEGVSPRTITLNWTQPTFGQIGAYRVYRSADGGVTFALIATVPGNPPATTFTDNPACNPGGYRYYVTAVLVNTTQESTPSNTVSTGQSGEKLTGCYLPPVFSSPTAGSSSLAGSPLTVTWTVKDASNQNGVTFANNPGSNTLVAVGPINNDALCATPTVNTPRTTIAQSGAGIAVSAGPNYVFSFNWNTTGFAAGCYLLELDLDSGQPTSGGQPASAFQVLVYLSDVSLQVTTPSPLPAATETVAYNTQLTESGGTTGGLALFSWSVVAGALPNGMALGVAPDGVSGALTGTPTTPGTYNFTVKVTDSIGDFGTQPLTLLVNALVSTTADSGAGSLRQAILDVNAAQPGPQPLSILFNISGAGVQTISPTTPLQALTQPTILDATTQPGYTGTPLIELNGTNAGTPATGLHIMAGNSTVRGLVIDSFNGDGILIDTNGGDVIQGNYVGTNPAGTQAAPNTGNGIQIIAVSNNTVGGAASAMGNIISGNGGEGVRIDGTLATGNVVRGNYIGTDVTGSKGVGNTASGVYIRRAPSNSVIGNVISGNTGFAGITICGNTGFCGGGDVPLVDETSNASANVVQGNLVGTNSAATAALSNSGAGVSIDGAPNNVVGGTTAGTPNTISFNRTNDVQIFSTGANQNNIQGNTIQGTGAFNDVGISVGIPAANGAVTGNTLTGNLISGHAGLGIDLTPPGVNSNTAGGANNYPVIMSAQVASGTINGTLNGPANAMFTIEFFSSTGCNASGNGEGAVFLGSTSVTLDGTGNLVFAFKVAGLVAGNTITATSTDASGTTSEFSACVTAN